jgi:hypothetical protein
VIIICIHELSAIEIILTRKGNFVFIFCLCRYQIFRIHFLRGNFDDRPTTRERSRSRSRSNGRREKAFDYYEGGWQKAFVKDVFINQERKLGGRRATSRFSHDHALDTIPQYLLESDFPAIQNYPLHRVMPRPEESKVNDYR